jgi:hypothetical protein
MCDYSLQAISSRPAVVGEKLVTHNFGYGTTGFTPAGEAPKEAVCLLPGTELAFEQNAKVLGSELPVNTGRFRQVNRDTQFSHHDAIEFSDGQTRLLTHLDPGQTVTVLQLPAAPRTDAEREEQRRVAYAG